MARVGTEQMVAAQILQWGAAPTVVDVAMPQRRDGTSLVRVTMASVTHLDLTVASGNFGIRPELPYTGGTEGVGIVVESTRFSTGERVCIRGERVGMGGAGCWAEYAVIEDDELSPAPPGLSDELAATYFDPCTAAWVAVHDVGGVASGETVLIGGAAGAVGSVAAQLASLAGASTVYGEVSNPTRIGGLPAGITPVITNGQNPIAQPGVDLLIDTVGGARLQRSLGLVRPGGRAVLVGYTAGERLTLDLPNWMLADCALLPLNMLRRAEQAERASARSAVLLAEQRISLRTQRFAFHEVPQAFEGVRSGNLHARAVIHVVPRS